MRTTLSFLAAGLFMVLLAGSCKKGDTGTPGTPGKNGVANISSRTFYVESWSYASPNYYATLIVPEITTADINSTGVLVYFKTTATNEWTALPYTQYNSPFNYYMNFVSMPGFVRVNWFYNTSTSQGDDPNKYYNTNVQFKVIVIPPQERVLKPDVNYTQYEEVKNAFKLKD
jgi:hypothetical protein